VRGSSSTPRPARGGPDLRELSVELAQSLRRHVLPQLGSHAGRTRTRSGAGGDVTFAIDHEAEAFLERFLAERAPGVAFYSEDRGLVLPDTPAERSETPPSEPSELPEFLAEPTELPESAAKQIPVLVVDPIDGTRPAMAGLESCCVSVAAAMLGDGDPTMSDVFTGCVVEIKTGALFAAERGKGVELRGPDDAPAKTDLSANEDLSRLFWSTGFRGRPAAPLVEVIGELIDASSVGGGFFDLGSATFDMTRILTGQLDAYLDVGSRMIDEVPGLRKRFEEAGGGAVLNNSPYDLAAAVLCLEEAGAIVTDACGEALGPRPLLGSGHEFQMSCIAAANTGLHAKLLLAVESGIQRLHDGRNATGRDSRPMPS
jgi:myo-inositol-1(or 4)-monophosphatase